MSQVDAIAIADATDFTPKSEQRKPEKRRQSKKQAKQVVRDEKDRRRTMKRRADAKTKDLKGLGLDLLQSYIQSRCDRNDCYECTCSNSREEPVTIVKCSRGFEHEPFDSHCTTCGGHLCLFDSFDPCEDFSDDPREFDTCLVCGGGHTYEEEH